MSKKSIGNRGHLGLLIMRIGVGLWFVIGHGYSKIAGGPEKWTSIGKATQNVGIDFLPVFFGFMPSISELLGGILLVLGLLTRYAAAFLLITMLVAISYHLANDQGIEKTMVYAMYFISTILIGPGKYSLDRQLLNKR